MNLKKDKIVWITQSDLYIRMIKINNDLSCHIRKKDL